MKNVLYITNLPVPYRTEFFNQLSVCSNLTVLYEGISNGSREKKWLDSIDAKFNKVIIDSDFSMSSIKRGQKIISYVLKNYKQFDEVIIGCCNTKPQMMLYLALWLRRKNFSVNLDGETFFDDQGPKVRLKRFFIRYGKKFYIAGDKSTESAIISGKLQNNKCIPYYFSSLTEKDIYHNEMQGMNQNRSNVVLVVAQYADYKRLDLALEVAKQLPQLKFKFVGTSNKTDEFKVLVNEMQVDNVEVIPFMPKEELEKEYLSCKFFLLPSRRECWGLVINEAASYGTPIIATKGVGAAVEFLKDDYPEFLADTNSVESILEAINVMLNKDEKFIQEYKRYLITKSKQYTIEHTVKQHMNGIELEY